MVRWEHFYIHTESTAAFEELNLTHPEEVLRVHQAYVNAGADVIQTNTYGANYIKLSRYGLEEQVNKMNSEAVKIARKASERRRLCRWNDRRNSWCGLTFWHDRGD